jgi:hypothetical protein
MLREEGFVDDLAPFRRSVIAHETRVLRHIHHQERLEAGGPAFMAIVLEAQATGQLANSGFLPGA